ncbi:CRISPR-associated protein Cmr5 [Candidatus Hakubella thermalkaliphila]|uniref:CRISPR type III-B/RAMP module-associated protein Cmr5 n=1 Tax=Candidatus Hakubella thermalkaliphila TaxID=2754717 RepID=A0A6V8QDX8_9ACTN|nr:type III-B CRISPR module-associated protein Cmr5 [Candidatus Hakubella thermalkaliphila]GFP30504.1 CRISPR-associated protein Cmr5 [Candidatus Hakubella thermalkaliphila]GFP37367.1 CRISPR-associated protein Cmr5 [Candidatus Hakubella thermalkaliphila]GFP39373.1 CRISPR-associated protein Cmr5 [Candidatus Hakubella thermalkaliphila]GFP42968.1 CRISPR-associated protein Cmr5 [Candidatus Hakubella thermalkaliphila]
MSMRTIEQRRASDAYRKISGLPQDKQTKEYRSRVQRFPALVQSCGLIQAVGFYRSKNDLRDIYDKLEDWFFKDDLNFPWPSNQRNHRDLFRSLGEIDVELYRMAMREALAYLTWLKRAAEALLPED